MKKNAKIVSVLALLLTTVLFFSGCGIVDFVSASLGNGETTLPVTDNTQPDTIVSVNGQVTNSAVVTPPSTSGSASTTTKPATTSAGSTSTTASSAASTSNAPATTIPATQVPSVPATEAATEEISDEKLESLTVKDLQDLLFATEDPNTAGKILQICGFEYDSKQGIYYSQLEPWQKNFGYNFIFDMAAPRAGMIYSTKRIYFNYGGKDWMLQIWKGQYGITSGAEVGLYNKTDKIMQYDCATEDEYITMAFDFYNQNEYVFSRGPEKHWWLTGFKVFHAGVPILIDLDITLEFPNGEMANAFEMGLEEVASSSGIDPLTYTRSGKKFNIKW